MHETSSLTPDLLLRHEAFVLRLARSLVRDEASAQDVAQETLLAALKHAPEPGGLRGWLARVVRHRASDLRRGARRRSEREESVARPEAQLPASSAAERLELEHGVVRAVLELDEPYRGVVVAVYYEGLAPAELARRNGVAPGTVRAQLSRALEMLRAKLDCEHGDRSTWGLALVGLLRAREGGLAAAGSGATGTSVSAWPLATAGAAALGATALLGSWWVAQDSRATEPVHVGALRGEVTGVREVPTPEREALAPARVDDERDVAAALDATPAQETAVAELSRMVAEARLLKSLILERRLMIDPEVRARYAWLEALPDAGVVRLSDRIATGHGLDLPWMQGGGSYFSFTELDHDDQRRPQIGLERGSLCSGFYGNYAGAVLDLGTGVFRELALDPDGEPSGLDERQLAAWDILRAPAKDWVPGKESTQNGASWLLPRLREVGIDGRAAVLAGHGYLVRAVSPDEFDVLVALEVAQADPDSCTLAWRVLEEGTVPDARPVRPVAPGRDRLPSAPLELADRSEKELRDELDRLRGRAEVLLFDDLPPSALQGREDAGLARLVDAMSPFVELPRVDGGGVYWSFAHRSHDCQDDVDLALSRGRFEVRAPGVDTGVVLDLGTKRLQDALALPSTRGLDAAMDFALWQEVDQARPRDDVIASLGELQQRVREMKAYDAPAAVGHSYLVRSIVENDHDLLAVFEVLELDERGALIAWQIVRTWPVPERR